MTTLRRALVITVLTQHSTQLINLAFTVILARLISPAELGVYAIASSVTVLAIELRAMGIGPYLIREPHLDETKIRAAFGLMMVISGGLGVVIFGLAPFASHFYHEPALRNLLWITASTFFLAPFSTIPNALITRDMKFHQIFVIKIVGMSVLSGSTLLLVWLGFSYYGMAWGIALGAVSELLLNNYFRPKGMPWLPSFVGLKGMLRFGFYLSASQMFVRFSENISDLVIGRVASKTDVGLFSRGFGFLQFLNRIISLAIGPVILPYLSAIKRDGGSVKDAYRKIMVLQGAISLPVFAVVNLAASPSIRLLFGEHWNSAIPLAATLSIWAIFQSIHGFSSSALISMGQEKIMFHSSLWIFVARIGVVAFASLAISPFSLEAVAWAFTFSGFVEFAIKAWVLHRVMGLGYGNQLSSMLPNLWLVLICWAVTRCIDHFVPFDTTEPWKCILLLAAILPAVWFGSLVALRHELSRIILNVIGKNPIKIFSP